MLELETFKLIANLGIAAAVVAMAFYMFYRIFNKIIEMANQNHVQLLDKHQSERTEWRHHQHITNKEFTTALKEHTDSTMRAFEKLLTEIQHNVKN